MPGAAKVAKTDGHVILRVFSPYQEVGELYTDLEGRVLLRLPFGAP